jgi:hypothetical protein
MKYAIIGPKGMIFRILDEEPKFRNNFIELTDEQGINVQNGMDSDPKQRYVWENDTLVTYEESSLFPVPKEVSMVKFREQLIREGLKQDIENALEAIPDEITKAIFKEWWEYATVVKRDYSKVIQMAQMLGYSDEYVDSVFKKASLLD